MAEHKANVISKLSPGDKVRIRIKRQERGDAPARWEEFEIPFKQSMNVISCLMEIQRRPVTASGEKTTPVTWDAACLEEVCGACSMVINGKVRQSCSALVEKLEQPITLEPMTKFPLVRDLAVDREVMFESLKRLRCWIPVDGTYDLGPGPRISNEQQKTMYVLSTCMTCGCCLEACPQVNSSTKFVGAAAISQVRLFNLHPTGAMHMSERLKALRQPGGPQDCGKAQNCARVCPKEIPLTTSIAAVNRTLVFQSIRDFFVKGIGEEKGSSGPS